MKAAVERVAGAIDRLCDAGAWGAAAACLALALMLITEVAATSLAAWSQPWAVEYSAYLCAIALFGGSGFALRQGAHIRVGVVLNFLPRGLQRAVDLACTAVALVVAGILCGALAELALRSHELRSVSYYAMQTPLWVPQGLLAASVAILVLALAARLARLAAGLAPDDPPVRPPGHGGAE
jgi:TRAP-type C4-dicarboxylate transport system permease small subunit